MCSTASMLFQSFNLFHNMSDWTNIPITAFVQSYQACRSYHLFLKVNFTSVFSVSICGSHHSPLSMVMPFFIIIFSEPACVSFAILYSLPFWLFKRFCEPCFDNGSILKFRYHYNFSNFNMSASTDFALALLRAASGPKENFVISPFSLG